MGTFSFFSEEKKCNRCVSVKKRSKDLNQMESRTGNILYKNLVEASRLFWQFLSARISCCSGTYAQRQDGFTVKGALCDLVWFLAHFHFCLKS